MRMSMSFEIASDPGTPVTLGMLREFVAHTDDLDDDAELTNPTDGSPVTALLVMGDYTTCTLAEFVQAIAPAGVSVCRYDGHVWPCDMHMNPHHDPIVRNASAYTVGGVSESPDAVRTWYVIGPHGREAWICNSRSDAQRLADAWNTGTTSIPVPSSDSIDPPPALVQWAQPIEGGA